MRINHWLFGVAVLLAAVSGRAQQTITLTSPTADTNFPDCTEFATYELNDPWDIDKLRDIPWDAQFTEPTATNGIWTGVAFANMAQIFPLFRGYSIPTHRIYDSRYDNGIPYGTLNPITASRYTRLSMRSTLEQADRTGFYVYWYKTIDAVEANYVGFTEVDNAGLAWVKHPSGYRVYDIDLTGASYLNELRNEPGAGYAVAGLEQSGTWDSTVYGLFVVPSASDSSFTTSVDWMRVYDPSSSPVLTINWNASVTSADPSYFVQLYINTANSGEGDLFQSSVKNDGVYAFYTGALPPGDYYFYVKLMHSEGTTQSEAARSAYSGRVRIGASPTVRVLAPTYTSGVDYATTVLGNPWDMAATNDLYIYEQISNLQSQNGALVGTTDWPLPGNPESDDNIWLNTKLGGEFAPIDTTEYRYLRFRMLVDLTGYTNINDMVNRGWVTRFMWAKSDLNTDGTYSQAIPLLEDWHWYTVDLWDTNFMENSRDGYTTPQAGWANIGTAKYFRMDPLETAVPTTFAIDEVQLVSMARPTNNRFTLSWAINDADSTNLTVWLFYGTFASGQDRVTNLLAIVTNSPGTNSYSWDTSAFQSGEYYVRVAVSDGTSMAIDLSDVPILMSSRAGPVFQDLIWGLQWGVSGGVAASGDFNGDGKDDLAVYATNTTSWYILSATGTQVLEYAHTFGEPWDMLVPGDYNGNGKADLGMFDWWRGYWHVHTCDDNLNLLSYAPWGWAGAYPVAGDYDGDGSSDLAVFDMNTGKWYVRTVAGSTLIFDLAWGWPGAYPVSGDYNGDGRSDLAIFDTIQGYWYILSSADLTTQIAWQIPWGWPGAYPVPGDYNGDGKDDLAIFDMIEGYWYILSLTDLTSPIAWRLQWGWPGAIPIPGDYVGDDKDDLAIYDTINLKWYVRPVSM
ncbi:MAG: VCBS repeat-containing protein [Lentisphaerae bacterium]|nr:VCBS repeat-containing protein [Lentisphaerota bacterium]